MDEDQIYKPENLEEHLLNRSSIRREISSISPISNQQTQLTVQQLTDIALTLSDLIDSLLQAYEEDNTEQYDESINRIANELSQPITTKLEVVLTSPLFSYLFREIEVENPTAIKCYKILESLSNVKEHCYKMIDFQIIKLIPLMIIQIKEQEICICKILTNLFTFSPDFLQEIIEQYSDDLVTLPEIPPSCDETAESLTNLISFIAPYFYQNEAFMDNLCHLTIFCIESHFSSSIQTLVNIINTAIHEVNFDISTNEELLHALLNESISFLELLNFCAMNIDFFKNLLFEMDYNILINKLKYEYLIFHQEQEEEQEKPQDGHELSDIEAAIILHFLAKSISSSIIAFSQPFIEEIIPIIFNMIDSSSFLLKKYILILAITFLTNVPSNFYPLLDIGPFIELIKEMFDPESTLTEECIRYDLINTIIVVYEKSMKQYPDFANAINESDIIPQIQEYIEENGDEIENPDLQQLFEHFLSLFPPETE